MVDEVGFAVGDGVEGGPGAGCPAVEELEFEEVVSGGGVREGDWGEGL